MDTPTISIGFEFKADADGIDKAVALLKFADGIGAETTTPPAPAPKTAKTPPPAPAPKGKAAAAPKGKANSKKPAPVEEDDGQMDILDVAGEPDEDEESGGLEIGDDDEPEFDGTAEEAKEEALGILRTMLSAGHKAHVKEVQQIMKVAKFHDVPAAQGHEFLKRVKAVQSKIGAH